MQDIKQVEAELDELEKARGDVTPRLARLQEKRADLQERVNLAIVNRSLGKDKNGTLDKLRAEIQAIDQEIDETQALNAGLLEAQKELILQREAVRLGLDTAELEVLIPKVEAAKARYIAKRRELLTEANQLAKDRERAALLRSRVQERRILLKVAPVDCGDLPGVPGCPWRDKRFSINPDQLRGVEPW